MDREYQITKITDATESFYTIVKGTIFNTTMVSMVRIEHFTKFDTNIDDLYNGIKDELSKKKNLKIVSEIKGEMNVQVFDCPNLI